MTTPTPTLPEALRQGHGIASEDGYFEARPQIDSMDRRKVFGAGFERGWEAALAAVPAQERIQALELEVRQLTEQIAGLRHAPTPQADSQPAPVVEGTPPPCDQELFDQGVSVGLFDIPKWTAEALCRGIAAATEARVDWHYIAGRVHIKALPAARAPADSVLEDAETALRKVLGVVQRYLPPDGPSAHDAMSEIIAIVDPWPLGPLEKP